jgi:ribosomal protein L16 Arg81 hydroxylase
MAAVCENTDTPSQCASMLRFDFDSVQFRRDYFERKPFLQRASLPGNAITWNELNGILDGFEPSPPLAQLLQDGRVPYDVYTEETFEFGQRRRRFNKAQFYAHMQRGATLVINRFENQSPVARRLCATVAAFAHLPTTSNSYLSLGGRGAFGKHWDTHDVFAIQMLGRKRWQVFEPTFPLPLSHQSSDEAVATGAMPVFDCVLEPGDVLYVPRGWWHQTLPLAEVSFHISVGAYAATMYDFVLWACARLLPDMENVRRAFDSAACDGTLDEVWRALGEALRDPSVHGQFARELALRGRSNSPFRLQTFLDPARSGLRGDEWVALTSCYPFQLENDTLIVNGRLLRLDQLGCSIVRTLAKAPLTFDAICRRFEAAGRSRVERVVLDLAQHEALAIY